MWVKEQQCFRWSQLNFRQQQILGLAQIERFSQNSLYFCFQRNFKRNKTIRGNTSGPGLWLWEGIHVNFITNKGISDLISRFPPCWRQPSPWAWWLHTTTTWSQTWWVTRLCTQRVIRVKGKYLFYWLYLRSLQWIPRQFFSPFNLVFVLSKHFCILCIMASICV